jgi:hypothetical protein
VPVTHDSRLATAHDSKAVWIAANGHGFVRGAGAYDENLSRGRVVLIELTGRVLKELRQPDREAYERAERVPCAGTTDDPALGSDGSISVADDHGKKLLHRFDADGPHLGTVLADSNRQWDTLHALLVDRRKPQREICVADRENGRIVVLGMDGATMRTFGDGVLTSPCGLAVREDLLALTDLYGSVVFFDRDDRWVAGVGGPAPMERYESWPNVESDGLTRRPLMVPGRFRSPHAISPGSSGTWFVTKWPIGGRLTRLENR